MGFHIKNMNVCQKMKLQLPTHIPNEWAKLMSRASHFSKNGTKIISCSDGEPVNPSGVLIPHNFSA